MEDLKDFERVIKQSQEYGRAVDSIQLSWKKYTLKSKTSGIGATGNNNMDTETEVLKPVIFIKYK